MEIIDGSWDWQSWTASLGVSMAGLTITEKDEAVNHSFRIVQRGELAQYTLGQDWHIHKDWAALAYACLNSYQYRFEASDTIVVF